MAVEPAASGVRVTLSAGGVYALRCATLTLGFLSVAIGAGRSHYPTAVAFPSLAGLGIVVGLFAFFGDYRARRGQRTTIGPVTRERLVASGLAIGVMILAALGTLVVTRLLDGRPITSELVGTVPSVVLSCLSFMDQLATWPWSKPTSEPLPAERSSGERG